MGGAIGNARRRLECASLLVSTNAWLMTCLHFGSKSGIVTGNATIKSGGAISVDGTGSGASSGIGAVPPLPAHWWRRSRGFWSSQPFRIWRRLRLDSITGIAAAWRQWQWQQHCSAWRGGGGALGSPHRHTGRQRQNFGKRQQWRRQQWRRIGRQPLAYRRHPCRIRHHFRKRRLRQRARRWGWRRTDCHGIYYK